MQIQRTSNYQPTSNQAFGMKISNEALHEVKGAIDAHAISSRLGRKIIGALENLKNTPQPEKFILDAIFIKKIDKNPSSAIIVRDSETLIIKKIYPFFDFTIPKTLKKLADTEYLEKMMAKQSKRENDYRAKMDALHSRLDKLKTNDKTSI